MGQEDRRRAPGWERDLTACQANTIVRDPSKVPMHWLRPELQEQGMSALWNLRDHMLRDALSITTVLELSVDQL